MSLQRVTYNATPSQQITRYQAASKMSFEARRGNNGVNKLVLKMCLWNPRMKTLILYLHGLRNVFSVKFSAVAVSDIKPLTLGHLLSSYDFVF